MASDLIEHTRHLATVNLWRNDDNSLSYTFAEASGVAAELGDSGAPVYLCAVNALRAAVAPEAADHIASLEAEVAALRECLRHIADDDPLDPWGIADRLLNRGDGNG